MIKGASHGFVSKNEILSLIVYFNLRNISHASILIKIKSSLGFLSYFLQGA
jgi:hypothetical protein